MVCLAWPGTLLQIAALTAGLWLLWVASSFRTWCIHFAPRVRRSQPISPSHGEYPAPLRLQATGGANTLLSSKCPMKKLKGLSGLNGSNSPQNCPFSTLNKDSFSDLDMNHIYISVWQYLWAAHAIGIPALILVVIGWSHIKICHLLMRIGLLPQPSDLQLHEMAFNLLLENLCVGIEEIQSTEDGEVATFVFSPFPIYVDSSTAVLPRHKSMMIVKVNLPQRKLVSADLDQERCSLSDAVVLLAHYIININHPKMHAYANWGIDPEADTGYLQKMSVVTACYNHYGYTNFPQMANNMVRKGAGACFGICLRESLKSGVKRHAQVVQLAQYSKLIDFIVRLRAPFKQAFSLCRQDFSQNISCEAHFLGTVIHSLDHFAFCRTINPWIFCALMPSQHLRTLHQTVLLARCCALDDIPTLGLPKHFKDGKTEFHRLVYAEAKLLNSILADEIQACIVK